MEDLTHPGWKNERIVGRFGLDYVVLVRHKDSMWLHRTEKIIDLVDRDLGYAPSDNKITPNTQVSGKVLCVHIDHGMRKGRK
jgi:hypothetical protein